MIELIFNELQAKQNVLPTCTESYWLKIIKSYKLLIKILYTHSEKVGHSYFIFKTCIWKFAFCILILRITFSIVLSTLILLLINRR